MAQDAVPAFLAPVVVEPGFLEPGVLAPGVVEDGVLALGVLALGGWEPGVLELGVLAPGVLAPDVLAPGDLGPGDLGPPDDLRASPAPPLVPDVGARPPWGLPRAGPAASAEASSAARGRSEDPRGRVALGRPVALPAAGLPRPA